jgi:hypothetical protein
MSVAYPETVKDALACVRSADIALDTALALLTKTAGEAGRPLITGYAGATADKHIREARKAIEKARTQLDSLRQT